MGGAGDDQGHRDHRPATRGHHAQGHRRQDVQGPHHAQHRGRLRARDRRRLPLERRPRRIVLGERGRHALHLPREGGGVRPLGVRVRVGPPGARRHHRDGQGVLRHGDQRQGGWPHRHGPLRQPRPENDGELQGAVHGREGRGQGG